MNISTTDRPRTAAAFRPVRVLVGCYLAISMLTLVAAYLLRADPALAPAAVWVRGSILVVVAALTCVIAARAARGSSRALLRLRIVTAVQVIAIVVVVALPGTFPLWMKIEQGICGLLLIGVVALTSGRRSG